MDLSTQAENIISQATQWNFQGDCSLLEWMKEISQQLEQKAKTTSESLKQLNLEVDRSVIALDNATNSLDALQHTQFVESLCREDDELINEKQEQPTEPKISTEDIMQKFLQNNVETLQNCHEKYALEFEDSDEDETETNCIYQPKNPYNERLLPHIYGTKLWKENWHVGLCEDTNDYSADEISDTYSVSIESPQPRETNDSNSSMLSEWNSTNSIPTTNTNLAFKSAASFQGSESMLSAFQTEKVDTVVEDDMEHIPHPPLPIATAQPETIVQTSIPATKTNTHTLFDENLNRSLINEISSKIKTKTEPPVPAARTQVLDKTNVMLMDKGNLHTTRKPLNLFDSPPESPILEKRQSIPAKSEALPVTIDTPKFSARNLFEDDGDNEDEFLNIFTKNKKPLVKEQKSLFDDDEKEEPDFLITKTSANKPNIFFDSEPPPLETNKTVAIKKPRLNLFDDDSDDMESDLFSAKKTPLPEAPALPKLQAPKEKFERIKQQKTGKLFDDKEVCEENLAPQFPSAIAAKPEKPKESFGKLFDDDEEDEDLLFSEKSKQEIKILSPSTITPSKLNKTKKKFEKLFDEENEDLIFSEQKTELPATITAPKLEGSKKNFEKLFDDEENEDLIFSETPKSTNNRLKLEEPKNNFEKLFNDNEENEDLIFSEKSTIALPKRNTPKDNIKKLFDDEENEDLIFSEKSKKEQETQLPPKLDEPKNNFEEIKNQQSKNLFHDDKSDEETEDVIFSENLQQEQNIEEKNKMGIKKQTTTNLFADDDLVFSAASKDEVPTSTTYATREKLEKTKNETEEEQNTLLPHVDDEVGNGEKKMTAPKPKSPKANVVVNNEENSLKPIEQLFTDEDEIPSNQQNVEETKNEQANTSSTKLQQYANLFSEEPPDDDDFFSSIVTNKSTEPTTRDFFEAPSIISSTSAIAITKEIKSTNENLDYVNFGLFSDIPPEDDFQTKFEEELEPDLFANKSNKQLTDTKDVAQEKIVSKLKLPQININVKALLPNAGGMKDIRKSLEEKREQTLDFEPQSSIIAIVEKEKTADNEHLLNNVNKGRVRGPVKRRPSTRSARRENYRQSLIVEQEEELEKNETIKPNVQKNIELFLEEDNNDDLLFKPIKSDVFQKPTQSFLDVDVVDADDDDDLFFKATKLTTLSDKKSTPLFVEIKNDEEVASTSRYLATTQSSLFDDSDDNDDFNASLFGATKMEKPKLTTKLKTNMLFDDENDSDDDIFKSNTKTANSKKIPALFDSVEKDKPHLKSNKILTSKQSVNVNIFGENADNVDNDDDDDLFSSTKAINREQTQKSKSNLLFAQRSEIPKQSSATDNPLADLL